jgi:hypothetical protein
LSREFSTESLPARRQIWHLNQLQSELTDGHRPTAND